MEKRFHVLKKRFHVLKKNLYVLKKKVYVLKRLIFVQKAHKDVQKQDFEHPRPAFMFKDTLFYILEISLLPLNNKVLVFKKDLFVQKYVLRCKISPFIDSMIATARGKVRPREVKWQNDQNPPIVSLGSL